MTITGMNHFTVLTDDVDRTVDFYRSTIGLEPGARPELGFPGAWLYCEGQAVLHIIGGTNYLFGTQLAKNGYVRNRDLEFTASGVPRAELVAQLEALIPLITTTVQAIPDEEMQDAYPIMFDDAQRPKAYVLVQLLAHLNYHLGQVNYLRRALE